MVLFSALLIVAEREAAAAPESLEGTWVSKVKVKDVTVTRRLTLDVLETENFGESLIETGRFEYERTVRDKILHIVGDFRHESSGGIGKLKLVPNGTAHRFGRVVNISHFSRPETDRIHLRLMLVEKTISCSCVLILDSVDQTFTHDIASAVRRNGRLQHQLLVAWNDIVAPLFTQGLHAIRASTFRPIAAKR